MGVLQTDKVLHLAGSIALPLLIVIAMAFTNIMGATIFMGVLAVIALAVHGKKAGNIAVIAAIAFAMGFISDVALNLYSGTSTGIRSQRLNFYFGLVGPLKAAVFAGFLTVWLVLPSYAIWLFIDGQNRISPWWILLIGMVFGFLIGFLSQPTRALRPLLPFYRSTSGWLENRLWDGISVVFALLPIVPFVESVAGSDSTTTPPGNTEEGTPPPLDSTTPPDGPTSPPLNTPAPSDTSESGFPYSIVIPSVVGGLLVVALAAAFVLNRRSRQETPTEIPEGFKDDSVLTAAIQGAQEFSSTEQFNNPGIIDRARERVKDAQENLKRLKKLPSIKIRFEGKDEATVFAYEPAFEDEAPVLPPPGPGGVYDDFPSESFSYSSISGAEEDLDEAQQSLAQAKAMNRKKGSTLERLKVKQMGEYGKVQTLIKKFLEKAEGVTVDDIKESYDRINLPRVREAIEADLKTAGIVLPEKAKTTRVRFQSVSPEEKADA